VTDLELARIVERAETRMWSDMVRNVSPEVAAALGLRAVPIGGGLALIASGVPSVLYNRAFGFGLDEPVDEATIDRMIALYRRDVPFSIQPCPLARPAEIDGWLDTRGLPSHFPWVRWVRGADVPPAAATDLVIERVGPDSARMVTDLAFTIFTGEPTQVGPWFQLTVGSQGWSHYVARDRGQPVGLSALYAVGGVGWLGWGGMLESHRGRGGQSAMIARRIRDGVEQGCHWFTVETADDRPEKPNPSFRNMARSGFSLLFRRSSHAHFPAKQDGASNTGE